jgi:uncharacterized protein YdeI (YjbR/CyaY-like superfamily)
VRVGAELEQLVVADVDAWQAWLTAWHQRSPGVWLVLAKAGAETPTRLRHDKALEEALCHGWIDGQVRRLDAASYRQRFTPRRPRSGWSKRNTAHAERLLAEGRLRPAGLHQIELARADGRWAAAYAGPATIEVPDDLLAALAGAPAAAALFAELGSQNRYAILYRLATARSAGPRARRLEQFVAMLARGETPYPQRPPRPGTR